MKSQLNQNRTMESFMLDTFLLPSFFSDYHLMCNILMLSIFYYNHGPSKIFLSLCDYLLFHLDCSPFGLFSFDNFSWCVLHCLIGENFLFGEEISFRTKNHQHISKYRTRDISKLFVIFFWRIFVTKISKIF